MSCSGRYATLAIRSAALAVIVLAGNVWPACAALPPGPLLPSQATLQTFPAHSQAAAQGAILGQGVEPGIVPAFAFSNTSGVPNRMAANGDGFVTAGVEPMRSVASSAFRLAANANGSVQTPTLYTVDVAPPACDGFVISVPLIGDICIDVSQLVNDLFAATFGNVADMFGGAWDATTAPFASALTNTPNFAADSTWSAFQTFMNTLQYMWGTVFVAMFVFGMFARYLESIGAGSFQSILGVLGRAMMLTGFLALYGPIMANWVFPAENGLAAAINDANILGTDGGFDAIGKALETVSNIFSLTSVVDLLILILALFVAVLCVVVRDMGLGVLAALYIVGPLALICWLSPQFDFIARWWVRTTINVLLWPVGYALALKVGSALLAASGWTGLLGSLGALGCLVLLYRVPDIIGSMMGSNNIAGAVTMLTDRGVQMAAMAAQRAVKRI